MNIHRKLTAGALALAFGAGALYLVAGGSDASAVSGAGRRHPSGHRTAAARYPIRHDCSRGSWPVTLVDKVTSGSVVFIAWVPTDPTVPTHAYDPSLGRVFPACLLSTVGSWAIDAKNWPDRTNGLEIGVNPGHRTVLILKDDGNGGWTYTKLPA